MNKRTIPRIKVICPFFFPTANISLGSASVTFSPPSSVFIFLAPTEYIAGADLVRLCFLK